MLQKRRIFDFTNTVMNFLFMVFVLLSGIYFFSFWYELQTGFLFFLVTAINVLCWTVSGVTVLLLILALLLAVYDGDCRIGALIWCVVRMAACIAVSIIIGTVSIVTSGGIKVSL
ncbi:MAG: hypothetical protein ACFN3H_06815 [Spirochaetales bacterium]